MQPTRPIYGSVRTFTAMERGAEQAARFATEAASSWLDGRDCGSVATTMTVVPDAEYGGGLWFVFTVTVAPTAAIVYTALPS